MAGVSEHIFQKLIVPFRSCKKAVRPWLIAYFLPLAVCHFIGAADIEILRLMRTLTSSLHTLLQAVEAVHVAPQHQVPQPPKGIIDVEDKEIIAWIQQFIDVRLARLYYPFAKYSDLAIRNCAYNISIEFSTTADQATQLHGQNYLKLRKQLATTNLNIYPRTYAAFLFLQTIINTTPSTLFTNPTPPSSMSSTLFENLKVAQKICTDGPQTLKSTQSWVGSISTELWNYAQVLQSESLKTYYYALQGAIQEGPAAQHSARNRPVPTFEMALNALKDVRPDQTLWEVSDEATDPKLRDDISSIFYPTYTDLIQYIKPEAPLLAQATAYTLLLPPYHNIITYTHFTWPGVLYELSRSLQHDASAKFKQNSLEFLLKTKDAQGNYHFDQKLADTIKTLLPGSLPLETRNPVIERLDLLATPVTTAINTLACLPNPQAALCRDLINTFSHFLVSPIITLQHQRALLTLLESLQSNEDPKKAYRSAYKKAVLLFHPDHNLPEDRQAAEQLFQHLHPLEDKIDNFFQGEQWKFSRAAHRQLNVLKSQLNPLAHIKDVPTPQTALSEID